MYLPLDEAWMTVYDPDRVTRFGLTATQICQLLMRGEDFPVRPQYHTTEPGFAVLDNRRVVEFEI